MHNIKDIRNDPKKFKESLKKRFLDVDLENLLDLDQKNRKLIQEKETLEKEKKEISKTKNSLVYAFIDLLNSISLNPPSLPLRDFLILDYFRESFYME